MIQGLPIWSSSSSYSHPQCEFVKQLFSHGSVSELYPDEKTMLVCNLISSAAPSSSTSEILNVRHHNRHTCNLHIHTDLGLHKLLPQCQHRACMFKTTGKKKVISEELIGYYVYHVICVIFYRMFLHPPIVQIKHITCRYATNLIYVFYFPFGYNLSVLLYKNLCHNLSLY